MVSANPPCSARNVIEKLLFQEFQNFRRMRFRIGNRNPMFFYCAVRSDQRRGPNRPFDGLTLGILPRAPCAVSFHDLHLRIGQQGERQVEFGDELIV